MIHIQVKKHYETVMQTRVLADLKDAEALYPELEQSCQVLERELNDKLHFNFLSED